MTFRHVAEYCDGWMPIHGRRDVLDKLDGLRAACDAVDRDPATVELGVFGVPPKPKVLEGYADVGVRRVVLGLPPAPADVVLPILDAHAEAVAALG